ncbi:inositol monophosphatase [Candidatus Saccharibacteria bacterium]|nr:inositol monophosphatase [Candidatus Saccharibacteria bacterium]
MDYKKELEFAKKLAQKAGDIMLRYFKAEDIGTVWKEDNTPLTVADTTINRMVIEEVKKVYPNHGIIGEEESFCEDREKVWVVDPIDGTMPFSLGIPVSTFSLALVDRSDGQSVLGVVKDPYQDHIYSAAKDSGAFLNDLSIHTGDYRSLNKAYISVLGGTNNKTFRPGIAFDLARDSGSKNFSLLSQVYAAVKVASGEFAGSIFGYGAPWDSAAVSIIVKEAGGEVTDLYGKSRRYDEWGDGCVLASNRTIMNKLLSIVDKASVKTE